MNINFFKSFLTFHLQSSLYLKSLHLNMYTRVSQTHLQNRLLFRNLKKKPHKNLYNNFSLVGAVFKQKNCVRSVKNPVSNRLTLE